MYSVHQYMSDHTARTIALSVRHSRRRTAMGLLLPAGLGPSLVPLKTILLPKSVDVTVLEG
jgi:hypothetical protein